MRPVRQLPRPPFLYIYQGGPFLKIPCIVSFCGILHGSINAALEPNRESYIIAGFKKTGIFPLNSEPVLNGGGGGFTRPIPADGAADQLRGVPVIGRLSMGGTRGL